MDPRQMASLLPFFFGKYPSLGINKNSQATAAFDWLLTLASVVVWQPPGLCWGLGVPNGEV